MPNGGGYETKTYVKTLAPSKHIDIVTAAT